MTPDQLRDELRKRTGVISGMPTDEQLKRMTPEEREPSVPRGGNICWKRFVTNLDLCPLLDALRAGDGSRSAFSRRSRFFLAGAHCGSGMLAVLLLVARQTTVRPRR